MRVLMLLACWATIVCARPDVGGYNYNNNNGIQQNPQAIEQSPQPPHQPQPQPQPQRQQLLTPLLHQQQQLPAEQTFTSFGVAPQPQTQSQQTNFADVQTSVGEKLAHADSYQQAYQQSSLTSHESGYAYAPTVAKIHKHIYVHVPPKEFEEEDAIQPRVHHQVGPQQKHYKIVFIKAPSAPTVRAPIVPPLPQNEEKTLIYVLHKKPEATQDIVIPTPAPTKPSKPEVYFIKYKTRREEAPVYGPPPPPSQSVPIVPADMEPRHLEHETSNEYIAPTAPAPAGSTGEDLSAAGDLGATLTTLQPAQISDEHHPQFITGELSPELYNGPTMGTIHVEDVALPTAGVFDSPAPSISGAPLPTNSGTQYLTPEPTTPIIQNVPEVDTVQSKQHLPAISYGPPRSSSDRFFIKKKK